MFSAIGSGDFFTGGPFPGSYLVMLLIGLILVFLGIAKRWEPLLLLPIGFSILLVNLFPPLVDASLDVRAPIEGTISAIYVTPAEDDEVKIEEGTPLFQLTRDGSTVEVKAPSKGALSKDDIAVSIGDPVFAQAKLATLEKVSILNRDATATGLFAQFFRFGIQSELIPLLIFLGLGALTDFGPLIANPKTLLLGAAAQFGVYFTFFMALLLGAGGLELVPFGIKEASSIGIIGGADGPTTVYLTTRLAPSLLSATAVAAYSYMAMVPLIQPPVIRLLTTKEERAIYMKPQLREVSPRERLLFPFIGAIVIVLLVPPAAPLIGMFMFGNLLNVCGVTDRLSETAGGAFMNILTILLGLAIGGIMTGDNFLKLDSLLVFLLGLVAFATATAFGVLFGKLMNRLSKEPINPMIGAAGVSAVPMSSRVVQRMGQQANPRNFLLMHAMGPNLAGVIGTITAAGIFISLVG